MAKQRIWLIVLSLLMIVSFAFMGVITPAIQDGRMPDDLMGVFGLLLAFSYIANIIIAFRYARETGRRAGLYALGTLFVPYIVPLVLALIPEASPGVEISSVSGGSAGSLADSPAAAGSGVKETAHFLSIPSPPGQFSQWHLDRLRLFCVVLPLSANWRVVSSSQEFSYYFPDLMSPSDESSLYGFLDTLCSSGKANQFSGITLCLAGFQENGSLVNLRKIGSKRNELLSGLYHFRAQRKAALAEWLDTNPQLTLRGGFGSTALLNRSGYTRKKITLSWPEVVRINTETMNGLVTHMFVLPESHSGGMFDFGKGKYSLPNIPTSKKALYVAEVQFWKSLASSLLHRN